MFRSCKEDRPGGFDFSKTSQFGEQWVTNYQDRYDLSVRRRTNKKKTSASERLHRIHEYQAHTQYEMGFADISSEESESSSSESDESSEDES